MVRGKATTGPESAKDSCHYLLGRFLTAQGLACVNSSRGALNEAKGRSRLQMPLAYTKTRGYRIRSVNR